MRLFFVLFLLTDFILFSQETKSVSVEDITINYSNIKGLVLNENKKNPSLTGYSFYNDKKSFFKIELFYKLTLEKIISIDSTQPFYLELILIG